MSPKIDLTGQRFGRLTALYDTNKRRKGNVIWFCVCDCKKNTEVEAGCLTNGNTKTCGCSRRGKRPWNKKYFNEEEKRLGDLKKETEWKRMARRELHDWYIKDILKTNMGLQLQEITPEMVAIKREFIKSHRILKRLKEAGL